MNQDNGTETLNPGGFWVRVAAQLVDALWYLVLLQGPLRWGLSRAHVGLSMSSWAQLLAPAVVFIAFWVWKGATPGKMLCSLKIVRADGGGSPGLGRCLGRYVAYYASLLPLGLGFFWVGWSSEKRAWHDLLAGTRVVRTDSSPRANRRAWVAGGLSVALFTVLILLPFMVIGKRALSRGRQEAFIKVMKEGQEFGKGRQDQACLDEAVRRAAVKSADFTAPLQNQFFLASCLSVAAPTEAFCTGVPAQTDIVGRTKWSLARVQAAGLDVNNPFQRTLFDNVVEQCEKRRSSGPARPQGTAGPKGNESAAK